MMNLKDKVSNERLRRTKEICKQVRDGSYIPPKTNLMETWFPERPVIEKDRDALQFIFNEEPKQPTRQVVLKLQK